MSSKKGRVSDEIMDWAGALIAFLLGSYIVEKVLENLDYSSVDPMDASTWSDTPEDAVSVVDFAFNNSESDFRFNTSGRWMAEHVEEVMEYPEHVVVWRAVKVISRDEWDADEVEMIDYHEMSERRVKDMTF